MKLTKDDYIKILEYYNIKYNSSNYNSIKRKAENILADKLCRCIKKVKSDKINEKAAIALCRENIFKKRNIDFNLTEQEFYSFWQKSCTYCGDKIDTIGLDRINSEKGYDMSNLVPCCATCNWMKIDKSTDDWIAHIKKILSHTEKTNAC